MAGEIVTPEDASRAGLPPSWYGEFVQSHFSAREIRAEQFRFAMDDPSIRALLRYKIEQRQLVEELAPVLDDVLSPYDAVAAGVAGLSLQVVTQEVFPDREEVSVRDLIPEISRRAVRDFLIGKDGRPSLARVRRALVRARLRQDRARELGSRLEQGIAVEFAIQSGAGDQGLRRLARTWFGESEELSVGQLLLAAHVPAFARLLAWHAMMTGQPWEPGH